MKRIKNKKKDDRKDSFKNRLIGSFFNKMSSGIRKLYHKTMNTKPDKISKAKFMEFVKKILENGKLTDTEIKELFTFYCKKNKKPKEDDDKNRSLKRSFKSSIKTNKSSDKRLVKEDSKDVEPKLEIEAFNMQYEEWVKQEENLSGVLNTKTLSLKNMEIKEKINYWRESIDLREIGAKRLEQKQFQLNQILSKYVEDLSIDKEKVQACLSDFHELMDNTKMNNNNERILNDFLLHLKEFKILEIRDLKKTLDQFRIEKGYDHAMLSEFVEKICRECVLNQHYFSFFDVPDMIVKMTPKKADYTKMVNLLNATKTEYIKEKADIIKKPVEETKVTDEDLVPLELIKQVLSQKKYQFQKDCEYINRIIQDSQDEVNAKIRQLQVENNKIKKIIENNVFISHINKVMDDNHQEVFLCQYKIRLLYLILAKTLLKSANEVSDKYFSVIQLNPSNNKEISDRLTKEMNKFSNKATVADASDTISDLTDDKLTKVFKRLGAVKDQPSSSRKSGDKEKIDDSFEVEEIDDELDRAKEVKFDPSKLLSGRTEKESQIEKDSDQFPPVEGLSMFKKPTGFQSFKIDKFKPPEQSFDEFEEEELEDKEALEERRRKEAEEAAWMAKYIDQETGEPFNPNKKFGVLENDYLVYDNVTSSYPLNLPVDYYQRYVKTTIPSKKNPKWFIRPHHVEKLTTHVKSIKDDILNTQYYSHYHDENKNKVIHYFRLSKLITNTSLKL